MPLSEFYGMAGGRLESSQQKPTSCSATHLPDELVELVWENGQIMMKGQSNRARRNTDFNNFQSQTLKFREGNSGNSTNPRMGKFSAIGTVLNDFTPNVPSTDLGLDQDDEIAPWLNYDDPLSTSYCPNFLPELSALTVHDIPDKRNSFNHTSKDSNVNAEHWPFEVNQMLAPSVRSGVSSGTSNSVGFVGPANPQASSGIINFSHFCRPVAFAHGNANAVVPLNSSGVIKAGIANKGKSAAFGNATESLPALVSLGDVVGSTSQPNLLPEIGNNGSLEKSETIFREDAGGDEPRNQVDVTVADKEMLGAQKVVEPVVASSSLCSGNNPEQASNYQNLGSKRKGRETDDSEGRSGDVEEESVGIRKAAPARGDTSAKRSRAAEVHNLSERRRRDRINEKMRALQELIPNCNKVDKASMLDEAIEYLKTLQLQVQIMSMGAGLYVPHMMLPAGIQQLPGHIAHYSPLMGAAMGVGTGFGMGMLDINSGVHFHGLQPMPVSGPANFHMMPGTPNLPVYGPVGPGLPVAALRGPLVPSTSSVMAANDAFVTTAPVEVLSSAPLSNLKGLMQNPNLPVAHTNAEACSSMNQTSGKCQVTNEEIVQSPLVGDNDQAPDHK